MASRVWAGRSRASLPTGTKEFSLLQNVQTSSGAYPAAYSMGIRVPSWEGHSGKS